MKAVKLIAICLLTAASGALAANPESAQPDILVIMPDQMRGDSLSSLGHPVIHTPQMDQLAKQGVLFRRAYASVPSCIPAHYAFLTGLYPQTSGVVGFKQKPITTPTLPGLLSDAGYSTVIVGRNMHQHPASGSCGFEQEILGSTYVTGDEYDQFLRKAAPETGGIVNLVENRMKISYNLWPAKPWPLDDELHPTEWTVAQSRKVVAATDRQQPLFLTASFYAPHPPLFPPKQYFDRLSASGKLPEPAHGDWVDGESLSVNEGQKGGSRVWLQGATRRAAQAGYFGLIEHLDNAIAPLIRDFKARSEKAGRPWVIVFTSDHGEMLGDHGYFRKCEPFEGSANVPFIISASASLGFKNGRTIHQPVTLEDIMPTLLGLAGAKTPAVVDGVDLAPTLRGNDQTIREWLHLEHAPIYSQTQAFHALTDGRFKYIWRPLDGTERLFDLQQDPREERDLSAAPAHRKRLEMWRHRLVVRLADRPEGFSQNGKLIPGRPYPALNAGTL